MKKVRTGCKKKSEICISGISFYRGDGKPILKVLNMGVSCSLFYLHSTRGWDILFGICEFCLIYINIHVHNHLYVSKEHTGAPYQYHFPRIQNISLIQRFSCWICISHVRYILRYFASSFCTKWDTAICEVFGLLNALLSLSISPRKKEWKNAEITRVIM